MVLIRCVPVAVMRRQFLLGEHNEGHVICNSIVKDKILTIFFPSFYDFLKVNGIRVGWINHPQTRRFKDYLGMLYDRHRQQVEEMERRGYKHNSPFPADLPFPIKEEKYSYTNGEFNRDLSILISRGGARMKQSLKQLSPKSRYFDGCFASSC